MKPSRPCWDTRHSASVGEGEPTTRGGYGTNGIQFKEIEVDLRVQTNGIVTEYSIGAGTSTNVCMPSYYLEGLYPLTTEY